MAVSVVADAGQFIREIINSKFEIRNSKQKIKSEKEQTKKIKVQKDKWVEWCGMLREKYSVPDLESLRIGSKFINTYKFIEALSHVLTGKEVIVPGSSGSCAEVTMQTIKVKEGLRILNTPGLGSMGFGLPAGLGACVASKKTTVVIVGDGGLQHNIQELETVRRLNISLKIFVLNNSGYASIRLMQNRHFKGRLVACDQKSGLTLPDLKKVARAYGLKYLRIIQSENLKLGIQKVLKSQGPLICEVFVDPMQETMPRISSRIMPGGDIVSMPMEDLYPFLERNEYNSNMLTS